MSFLKNIFTEDSSNGFIWNAIGGSLFAGQSVILLFLCARFYDQETAGVVSISYALANLIYMIALYGVRNFQVTDTKETYRFTDYLVLRALSILFAVAILLSYMVLMYKYNGYSGHKCAVVIAMTVLKMVNAAEDVIVGRLQQRGFFVVGARMGAVREFIMLTAVCILICMKFDIVAALICGTVISLVMELFLVSKSRNYLRSDMQETDAPDDADVYAHDMDEAGMIITGGDTVSGRAGFDRARLLGLLRSCTPLCVSTVLAIYLSNIPKYVTDWYLDEITQAIVGYLILPVFIIALLNQFIYTPFIKGLGDLWNAGNRRGFINRVALQSVVIISSAGIILLISYWIGIPLLSMVYNIDLRPYMKEFVLLLVGGGLYALEYYLIIPVTVMHEQVKIALSYMAAIVMSLAVQKSLVAGLGLTGVGVLYILVNLIITVLLVFVICKKYRSVSAEERVDG